MVYSEIQKAKTIGKVCEAIDCGETLLSLLNQEKGRYFQFRGITYVNNDPANPLIKSEEVCATAVKLLSSFTNSDVLYKQNLALNQGNFYGIRGYNACVCQFFPNQVRYCGPQNPEGTGGIDWLESLQTRSPYRSVDGNPPYSIDALVESACCFVDHYKVIKSQLDQVTKSKTK